MPTPPISVIADSCVAITDSPAAHHGMLRPAAKKPSIVRAPSVRRTPSQMV